MAMRWSGPDSVRSWLVAAACCFVHMVFNGLSRLSGILFVASMERFHVGREAASFPYTFISVVGHITAPFAGYVGSKVGMRPVAMFGCALAAAGVGACFVAETINAVTLLWGLVFGIGHAMTTCFIAVLINQHFDKQRATASGISNLGNCLGSLILPPIVDILVDSYGLSATFLFLSLFVVCCIPVAFLFRSPDYSMQKERRQSVPNERKSLLEGPAVVTYVEELPSAKVPEGDSGRKDDQIIYYNPIRPKDLKAISENAYKQIAAHSHTENGGIRAHEFTKTQPQDNRYHQTQNSQLDTTSNDAAKNSSTHSEAFSASCSNETAQSSLVRRQENAQTSIVNGRPASKPPEYSPSLKEQKSTWKIINIVTDPVFIIIAVTLSLYSFMLSCLLTIVVDYSKDLHVGRSNEKYTLMSISLGELIGRLTLGYITDWQYMSETTFIAFSYLLAGVLAVGIAWSTGLGMLVAMLALHGFVRSGVPMMSALLIDDFLEKDLQILAIPCSSFLAGPLALAVSPLIGFFRVSIGTYEYMFLGIGFINVLCACVWLAVPFIFRHRMPSEVVGP